MAEREKFCNFCILADKSARDILSSGFLSDFCLFLRLDDDSFLAYRSCVDLESGKLIYRWVDLGEEYVFDKSRDDLNSGLLTDLCCVRCLLFVNEKWSEGRLVARLRRGTELSWKEVECEGGGDSGVDEGGHRAAKNVFRASVLSEILYTE